MTHDRKQQRRAKDTERAIHQQAQQASRVLAARMHRTLTRYARLDGNGNPVRCPAYLRRNKVVYDDPVAARNALVSLRALGSTYLTSVHECIRVPNDHHYHHTTMAPEGEAVGEWSGGPTDDPLLVGDQRFRFSNVACLAHVLTGLRQRPGLNSIDRQDIRDRWLTLWPGDKSPMGNGKPKVSKRVSAALTELRRRHIVTGNDPVVVADWQRLHLFAAQLQQTQHNGFSNLWRCWLDLHRIYPDRDTAEEAARGATQKGRGDVTVYQCPHCGWFKLADDC